MPKAALNFVMFGYECTAICALTLLILSFGVAA
jgi:hypothetical protein